MTTTPDIDPVTLGRRVVEILEIGRRVATYKLATLSALIEYCVQHFPVDDPDASLDVPLDDLADRVIALCWRQVLPFKGAGLQGPDRTLRQNTGRKARILGEVEKFRETVKATDREMSLDIARSRARRDYERTRRNVRNVLVWRPPIPLAATARQGWRTGRLRSFSVRRLVDGRRRACTHHR